MANKNTILKQFIPTFSANSKYTYVVALKNGNVVSYHPRYGRPCYGELRDYGTKSTDPDTEKPSDLTQTLPEGKPVGLIISLAHLRDMPREVLKLVFDPIKSPWKNGLPLGNTYFLDDDTRPSLLLTNGNFEPTVLVNLLKCLINIEYNIKVCFDSDIEVIDQIAAHLFVHKTWHRYGSINNYCMSPFSNISRFYKGNTRDLTGGTWGERTAYNRKEMADIFTDEEKAKIDYSDLKDNEYLSKIEFVKRFNK